MYFRDVIGHDESLRALRAALREGRAPHALIFSGKRGVGKRTIAEALAAASLCESRSDEACGTCPSCRAFSGGNHPDYEHVGREPGKRDIGIGQVRALLDVLHRKTHLGRGRVALIDEAERLTMEAQNAFLKTLEEPPAGSMLVLVSAVSERLLPTVRSRCARHRFGRLDDAQLAEFARRRAVTLPGIASVPVALAAGSPGLLERLAGEDVEALRRACFELLSSSGAAEPFLFAERLKARADDDGDDEDDQDAREKNRDRLALQLRLCAWLLRDLALLADGVGDGLVHADARAALEGLAPAKSGADWLRALEACEAGIVDLRRNMDPTLALEKTAQRIQTG